MDLIKFLNARLDEDEEAALAVSPTTEAANWTWDEVDGGVRDRWQDEVVDGLIDVNKFIARNDPARVLREVAAKRALLSEYLEAARPEPCVTCSWSWRGQVGDCCSCGHPARVRTAILLAGAWLDHPDYDPAWVA